MRASAPEGCIDRSWELVQGFPSEFQSRIALYAAQKAKLWHSACMLECEMNPKYFRWPFLFVLAALIATMSSLDVPATIGLSGESSGDGYRISGGTAPWALTFSVVIIALYLLLMYSRPAKQGLPFPGWWRRLSAFWLELFLTLMTVSPIVGLLPTFTEWRRTGVFAWSFERTTPAPGDGFLLRLATDAPQAVTGDMHYGLSNCCERW